MKKWLLSISLVGAGLLLMVCQSKQRASNNAAASNNNANTSTPAPEKKEDVNGKAVIHGTQDQEKLDSIKRVKNAQKRP